MAEGQGQRPKKGGHGCHDDWKKAQSRRLKDRFSCGQTPSALSIQSEIDHHDGVLHHDADNQYTADGGNEREIRMGKQKRKKRSKRRGGKRRQNCQRVSEAFVKRPRIM